MIKRKKRVDTTDFLDMGNASDDSRWSTDVTPANVDIQHLDINNENNEDDTDASTHSSVSTTIQKSNKSIKYKVQSIKYKV